MGIWVIFTWGLLWITKQSSTTRKWTLMGYIDLIQILSVFSMHSFVCVCVWFYPVLSYMWTFTSMLLCKMFSFWWPRSGIVGSCGNSKMLEGQQEDSWDHLGSRHNRFSDRGVMHFLCSPSDDVLGCGRYWLRNYGTSVRAPSCCGYPGETKVHGNEVQGMKGNYCIHRRSFAEEQKTKMRCKRKELLLSTQNIKQSHFLIFVSRIISGSEILPAKTNKNRIKACLVLGKITSYFLPCDDSWEAKIPKKSIHFLITHPVILIWSLIPMT